MPRKDETCLDVSAFAGAACHSDGVDLSHVLVVMQAPEAWAKGTVRFSACRMTTEEEMDCAVAAVSNAVKRLSRIKALWPIGWPTGRESLIRIAAMPAFVMASYCRIQQHPSPKP